MMMYCGNKGCGKDNEPVLDVATNIVYCTECNQEMPNVTIFTKRQMKASGQIRRDDKKNKAFAVKCNTCNKMTGPKVNADNTIACELCEAPLALSKPFEQIIRDKFKVQK